MLLLRKGVYPYECMDSWERFNETSLPDKESFYRNLNMENVTNIDCRHAKNIFSKFNIKNLGEYHDLYVQSDTLLLANVFTSFRNVCYDIYGLDPAHFLSAPGLAWQARLKKSEKKLELLTDVDMLLMIEEDIRGSITQAVHRYCKANNKYMDKKYNKNKKSKGIEYYDANSLYVWAMTQKLPVNCFQWERVSSFTSSFIKNYNEDDDKRYILEVDLEYPKNLHDLHSDLPFLPERMRINRCNKLICNLSDKNKYVVHIKSLKQALNHGLILKKVRRVISFYQEPWLKQYIITNTEERNKADSDFKKDFYKLMCNAVFGKSMEQVRNHRDIRLVTTNKRRNQLVSEPNYHSTKWFSEELLAIEMRKIKIKMNKPIYLGLAILDISKTVVYELWYDYLKPKYEDNLKLCYMDTDSFTFQVETKDFYTNIFKDVEGRFDTSAYSKEINRPIRIGKNNFLE